MGAVDGFEPFGFDLGSIGTGSFAFTERSSQASSRLLCHLPKNVTSGTERPTVQKKAPDRRGEWPWILFPAALDQLAMMTFSEAGSPSVATMTLASSCGLPSPNLSSKAFLKEKARSTGQVEGDEEQVHPRVRRVPFPSWSTFDDRKMTETRDLSSAMSISPSQFFCIAPSHHEG